MLLSYGAVPARPRRRGPRRRARVRGADLAVELREQVGVALLVQFAPVDELPRPQDESGAKTVSKSFAITARSPEACKKNQFSGLGPTKAYALEVSILKVLNEKRNASSYTTRKLF